MLEMSADKAAELLLSGSSEPTSLDDPMGEDGSQGLGDFIAEKLASVSEAAISLDLGGQVAEALRDVRRRGEINGKKCAA